MRPARFRFGLIAFDAVTIVFFTTTPLEPTTTILLAETTIGLNRHDHDAIHCKHRGSDLDLEIEAGGAEEGATGPTGGSESAPGARAHEDRDSLACQRDRLVLHHHVALRAQHQFARAR